MKRNQRKIHNKDKRTKQIIGIFILLLLLILPWVCSRHTTQDKAFDAVGEEEFATNDVAQETDSDEVASESEVLPNGMRRGWGANRLPVRVLGRLREVFNDSNHRHLVYAKELGIDPINGVRNSYRTRRPVVRIASNKYYEVDTLTHSFPYLVPEAEHLLHDVGVNFMDTLKSRGGSGYRIRVTSLLRTPASVKRLRRVNVNASDSSCHRFGTTFDLAYNRFHNYDPSQQLSQEDLKNLLAEVLYDLRNEGRCLVKYEYKTNCFHVTVCK